MSVCNGGIPSEETETYFTTLIIHFPPVENEKINTSQFLEASKSVVTLIETFGTVFSPVKYDMNGNIQKLTQKYNEDVEKYKYLEDMINHEKQQGSNFATDALMWLRRALHLLNVFFNFLIIENQGNDQKTENVSNYLKIAYVNTLQQYHGWVTQQLFSLVCRMCPSRNQLYEILSLGKNNREEQMISDMAIFNEGLRSCIEHLVSFYTTNGYEAHNRV